MKQNSVWLFGKKVDILGLYLPVWSALLILVLLPTDYHSNDIPVWVWVIFVLGLDVGHVWTSIYRTYFSEKDRIRYKTYLWVVPLIAFLFFGFLAFINIGWYWMALAYFALYHFIKQQFGFMQLYKFKNKMNSEGETLNGLESLGKDYNNRQPGFIWNNRILKSLLNDKWVVYLTMVYPVLIWHFSSDRVFNWFVPGDFLYFQINDELFNIFVMAGNVVYFAILVIWVVKQVVLTKEWGKTLWVVTTALNWYLGIVWFNSDLVFTVTNVLAHGLPYFILIIYYKVKTEKLNKENAEVFGVFGAKLKWPLIIVFSVLTLAYIEEYFWDMWLYRDNVDLFTVLFDYPMERLSGRLEVALAFGILVVPQVSHYIFDGIIWKSNKQPELKRIFS